jgi:hypothetical protein
MLEIWITPLPEFLDETTEDLRRDSVQRHPSQRRVPEQVLQPAVFFPNTHTDKNHCRLRLRR